MLKLAVLLLGLTGTVLAQTPAQQRAELFRSKTVPHEAGFRVFIVPDMEGMGSAVDIHEVIAGNEGARYVNLTSPDYWDRFRLLLTEEVNATIRGARLAGARSFVVNEGHGGNMFANVLPWELDSTAILVRGFPKPMVMAATGWTPGALRSAAITFRGSTMRSSSTRKKSQYGGASSASTG